MRALMAISLLSLLSFALAGCTGGETEDGGDDFITPATDDEGRYVIEMGGQFGNRFAPEKAKVPVGATVVWMNLGGSHNVVFDDGGFPGSDVSGETGEHHEVTFTTAGTYDYHCVPHQSLGMVGTIRVE